MENHFRKIIQNESVGRLRVDASKQILLNNSFFINQKKILLEIGIFLEMFLSIK